MVDNKDIDINIKNTIKEKTGNKNLKKYVYSLRINTEQRQLLKHNPEIKSELDKLVVQYLNIYLK